MPVRIYSLAKELNVDSKDLVEICTKAGITGKGSALASLTDEETERLRAFLAKPKAAGAPAAPAAAAPAAATPAAPASGTAAAPPRASMRREDYIGPGATGAKPPVLTPRPARLTPEVRKKPGEPGEATRPPVRHSRTIRVAPLPPTQESAIPPVAQEPAPQKPDIKLPADAIRASRAGGATPLQDHIRKHEARRRAEQTTPEAGRPRGPAPAPAPADQAARGRERGRRGGKAAGDGESPGFNESLGGREQRQLSRKRTTTGPRREGEEEATPSRRSRIRQRPKRTGINTAAPRKGKAILQLPCTVRSFSEAVGVPVANVLRSLMAQNVMANVNATLDPERVDLLAAELGVEFEIRQEVDLENRLLAQIEDTQDDAADLEPRAPVVTFLGHVDHGKTSLLDRILGIDVASQESGGITQHIRAYRVEKDGRAIAFVDTPGHEAFTEMRARGANVTDIAVLVVAADDGVMPQTEEAISHARAAEVPIVIALNKIDLPGINYDRIYTQLVNSGLQPTEWGGDTELVKCSAQTGQGVDDLLDMLLTMSELHEYKANPARQAYGTCLEAELHEGRGVVAKLLVQNGTLKVGDVIVCGPAHGRVKAMYDTLRPTQTYMSVGPSTPVNMTGFDVAPGAGDRFFVLSDIAEARDIAQTRQQRSREATLSGRPAHVTLENLFDRLGTEEVQTLNLILRADVRGSIEAIEKELTKLDHPEVQIRILQKTVGGITEADVTLADASDAIIIGFNVVPDEGARALADQRGVQIRRYDIIYQVTEDIKAALEGMLKPEDREVELGRTLVQRTFTISRVGTVAGCRVLQGTVERNARARVIRDNRVLGDYALESLRREKDDVREVREGYECGIKLANFNDLKEGDVLEVYRVEQVARTLTSV